MPSERPSCPVVSVLSGKGGVGKTLISVNLAALLAKSGKRILLVDFDFASRGSSTLLLDVVGPNQPTVGGILSDSLARHEEGQPGAGETVGVREKSVADLRSVKDYPNLLFLPASPTVRPEFTLKNMERESEIVEVLLTLFQTLARVHELDLILIDCRPGPGTVELAIARSSDAVLLISPPDSISWDSTLHTHQLMTMAGVDTKNVWFVINQVPERFGRADLEDLDAFLARLKIAGRIPFELAIFESFGAVRFVVDDEPHSVFATQLAKLAVRVIEPLGLDLIAQEVRTMAEQEASLTFRLGRVPGQTQLLMVGLMYMVTGFFILLWRTGGFTTNPLELAALVSVIVGFLGITIAQFLPGLLRNLSSRRSQR